MVVSGDDEKETRECDGRWEGGRGVKVKVSVKVG